MLLSGCLASPSIGRDFYQRVVFIGDSITARWDLHGYFGKGFINKGVESQNAEEIAARFQSPLRESFRNPVLLGQMEAGSIITNIENAPSATRAPAGAYVPDEFGFWQILRDIGSGWERNQRVWNKEKKQ